MSWDPIWEEVHGARAWGRYPPEELIRFVARHFYGASNRKAVRILELGCGAGANLWYLAREGFDVYGIDGSIAAVGRAEEYLASEGLSAQLRVGDAADALQIFPGIRFDAVIDVACLYHNRILDVETALAHAFSALKPGGRIFSSMVASGSWGETRGDELEPGTRRAIDVGPFSGLGTCHFFTLQEIERLFEPFSDVVIEYSERSLENRSQKIRFWVTEGVRPA